jgi:hypothetical protein
LHKAFNLRQLQAFFEGRFDLDFIYRQFGSGWLQFVESQMEAWRWKRSVLSLNLTTIWFIRKWTHRGLVSMWLRSMVFTNAPVDESVACTDSPLLKLGQHHSIQHYMLRMTRLDIENDSRFYSSKSRMIREYDMLKKLFDRILLYTTVLVNYEYYSDFRILATTEYSSKFRINSDLGPT